MTSKIFHTLLALIILTLGGYPNIAKSQPLNNSNSTKQEKELTINHLTGNYYIIKTYNTWKGKKYDSNSMYVVTRDGVVLLDGVWDTTKCQSLLDYILKHHQKKVVLAIGTHFHDDRTGGFDYFQKQGIKTYSSKQTYDLCKSHHFEKAEFYFSKDTIFTVGEHTFQTYYPGEGHTKDNIVVWCRKQKVLYGGCLVNSLDRSSLGNIADANLQAWPTSIKNVTQKFHKHQYVTPGHGEWTSNNALEHTLKLLDQHKPQEALIQPLDN